MKKLKKSKKQNPDKFERILEKARHLLISYEIEDALELLLPLQEQYHSHYDFNSLLFEAFQKAEMPLEQLLVANTLLILGKKKNEQDWVNLIETYQLLGLNLKALHLAYEAAEKFPQNNRLKIVIRELKQFYDEAWQGSGLNYYRQQYPTATQESALHLLAMQEQLAEQMLLQAYPEGMAAAEQLLKQFLDDVYTVGILGQFHAIEGRLEIAEQYSQKAVNLSPEYLPPLANLAYFGYLRGKSAAENLAYQQIKKADEANNSFRFKAELMLLYEEYELLTKLYQGLNQKFKSNIHVMSQNFVATAYALLGNWSTAEKMWHELEYSMPGLEEDLEEPKLNLQQRPFCYTPSDFQQLNYVVSDLENLKKNKLVEKIKADPFFIQSLKQALKFGDENCRQMCLYIMDEIQFPEFEPILWEFGTGPIGASPERLEALHILQKINPQRIQKGIKIPFWFRRQQQEINWLYNQIEFVSEDDSFSASDEQLMDRAYATTRYGDLDQAIALYEKISHKYPNNPVFQNNLLFCYIKKQPGKAEELLNQFLEKFPDYFFGYVQKIDMWLNQNNFKQVELALEELNEKFKSYEMPQLIALCGVYCRLALARKDKKEAQYWYDLIEALDKKNDLLFILDPFLDEPLASSFLKKLWNKHVH